MLDIGCGAGRALAFGMQQNFEQVSGIDLDEPALEQAMINCRNLQQHGSNTQFSILRMDATTCPIPETVNVLYLYNPFGMKTMQAVVDNIMKHMDKRKEDLYIIYSNPTYRELFNAYPVCNKIFQSSYKDINRADLSIFRIKSKIERTLTKALLLWEGGFQMILE
jgi:predicted RNA methylase